MRNNMKCPVIARGRNTLFQPVHFPLHQAPWLASGRQYREIRDQDYCMFLVRVPTLGDTGRTCKLRDQLSSELIIY